jgi:hypothetical protein
MTFPESNTIEQMILNAVAKLGGKQVFVLHWSTRLWEFSL